MSGFRTEKELWKYQKVRLSGVWHRVECVTPSGHPDIVGSHLCRLSFIENKVGDYDTAERRRKSLEAAQVKYFNWLDDCAMDVYVCFGSKKTKAVTFYHWRSRLLIPSVPAFWTLDKSV